MKDTYTRVAPIPRSALILGCAGVIPFVWGALTVVFPALFDLGHSLFGPRFVGPYVLAFYGAVILSFMAGVLWGFAARAAGQVATIGYSLSVLPALWVFFTVGGGSDRAILALIAGFIGILGLDWYFWTQLLAPAWWMRMRQILTLCAVACLTVGLIA